MMKAEVVTAILFGLCVGYSWHYFAVKDSTEALQRQNRQYQLQYEDYIDSKEYKAIQTCKESDYWKAECLAWEMNNNEK